MGSRVTRTALPVIAVLSLTGSPSEVALLAALSFGPGVVVGLLSGGWVDRSRKREILVAADVVRALAVATVPAAAWLGLLGVGQVYVVALVVGAATALFQIADVALLPLLLPSERLVQGNARLAATESFAEVTGPALAGVLIQRLGAPLAVLVDAASYVWSASFLRSLRVREAVPAGAAPPADGEAPRSAAAALWHDVRTGMGATFSHPVVGPVLSATGVAMFAAGFFAALYMLYALRTLGFSPATVGAIVGVGGVGALAGTAAARLLPGRIGFGRTLIAGLAVYQGASLLVPLAGAPALPRWAAGACLVAQQLVGDAAFMAFAVLATSARQALLPSGVLGRANAAQQVVTGALLPLGALLAGPVAGVLGVRETLWLGSVLGLAGPLVLASSGAVRRSASLPALAAG